MHREPLKGPLKDRMEGGVGPDGRALRGEASPMLVGSVAWGEENHWCDREGRLLECATVK